MDISKLDPALLGLLGVVVGSLLSLLGNFLGQWYTLKREERNWVRQRKAAKEDIEDQARKNSITYTQDIYNNCMSCLSTIASQADKDERILTDEKLAEVIAESFEWIAKLKLYQRDLYSDSRSRFRLSVDNFVHSPDGWRAQALLAEINNIFTVDNLLFPNASPTETAPGHKSAQMSISDVYRREQIIKGKEIPSYHVFEFNISDLSEKQLEILWDIHHQNNRGIPDRVVLAVPRFDEKQKNVSFGVQWEGKINPLISSPRQIFDAWEKDYIIALDNAETLLRNAQKSESSQINAPNA